MKSRFGALLVLAAALATATVSGSVASAQPTSKHAAPSARALKLTKDYLELIQINQLVARMMDSMGEAMLPPATEGGITPEERAIIMTAMKEAMAIQFPKMLDKMAVVYAQTYTEDELQALVDFYGTPAGRSITAKTSVLAGTSGQILQDFAPEFEREMMGRVCAKVDCKAKGKAEPKKTPA